MTDKKLSDVEIDGYLARMRSLATMMLRTTKQTDEGMPGCWFGGQPTLPAHIEWPVYKCPFPEVDVPLHFIFQIDLRFVPRAMEYPEFPERGTLFVFVEPILAPFDETSHIPPLLSGEGAKVIYVADDVSQCPPRKAPLLPDPHTEYPDYGTLAAAAKRFEAGYFGGGTEELNHWPMEFLLANVYDEPSHPSHPDWPGEDENDCLERSVAVSLAYDKYKELVKHCGFYKTKLKRPPKNDLNYKKTHRMFGYEYTCVARSHSFHAHDHWPKLTRDHVLLFQVMGQDYPLRYEYPNGYALSFWIPKSDLKGGNFENILVWKAN
ncbi:DUF1963 domain-containing protein [Halocynthiibacter styelae]|uniref:DUF1963 domain-containing protein n=1 Tax=Halocynthiibacter styelae TaxID=2761955 RepID=A0A8J7LQ17_9RHOB|nr:DUF1963 domain-containing protein [Paenihalocynthiibacter styelae]MBI1493652.1 DUF1963 domain-containing protein [Paenihalocynthiibacter styelae]